MLIKFIAFFVFPVAVAVVVRKVSNDADSRAGTTKYWVNLLLVVVLVKSYLVLKEVMSPRHLLYF